MRALVTCLGIAVGCVALGNGCTSFSSSILNRSDDNSFVGNSNGSPTRLGSTRPYKGVPITLKVPSHLDVYIEETYFMETDCHDETRLVEVEMDRLLNVRTELIKTKKVFMVDLKRPGSGTLNSNLSFSDDQYLKSIDSVLQDTTIVDSAQLLATILKFSQAGRPLTGPVIDASRALDCNVGLMERTRVVAYRRFDLNACDFEQQVEAFVNHHLNDCNTCRGFQKRSTDEAGADEFEPTAPVPAVDVSPASYEGAMPRRSKRTNRTSEKP